MVKLDMHPMHNGILSYLFDASEARSSFLCTRLQISSVPVLPLLSAIIRITCRLVGKKYDGLGAREGGMNVMQGLLTRFSDLDAVFGANDPMALGAQLAAKQLKRTNIIITGVDGAPDTEKALADPDSLIKASASQDPYVMAGEALKMGYDFFNGKKPEKDTVLIDPVLITADNLKDYKGWTSPR
nr:substrate-binding domain-containing protein [uncultured Cohaesibacter sp.]